MFYCIGAPFCGAVATKATSNLEPKDPPKGDIPLKMASFWVHRAKQRVGSSFCKEIANILQITWACSQNQGLSKSGGFPLDGPVGCREVGFGHRLGRRHAALSTGGAGRDGREVRADPRGVPAADGPAEQNAAWSAGKKALFGGPPKMCFFWVPPVKPQAGGTLKKIHP